MSAAGPARHFGKIRIWLLSGHSGHRPTCCWLDRVATDPKRTLGGLLRGRDCGLDHLHRRPWAAALKEEAALHAQ
jgi:hypothetical protein